MMDGNVAGTLVDCVVALDRVSRSRFTKDDDVYEQTVKYRLASFLDAFAMAREKIFPLLDHFARSSPIQYAGIGGRSYHEIVSEMAVKQYDCMFLRLKHEECLALGERQDRLPILVRYSGSELTVDDALREWPVVSADLADLFGDVEPLNRGYLFAGVSIERPRGDVDPAGPANITPQPKPQWNDDLKQLIAPNGKTRKYAGQATNCHAVLAEFERNSWPTRIDDPLPFKPSVDACERVESTCVSLNKDLVGMRFRVADGGKSFIWEKS